MCKRHSSFRIVFFLTIFRECRPRPASTPSFVVGCNCDSFYNRRPFDGGRGTKRRVMMKRVQANCFFSRIPPAPQCFVATSVCRYALISGLTKADPCLRQRGWCGSGTTHCLSPTPKTAYSVDHTLNMGTCRTHTIYISAPVLPILMHIFRSHPSPPKQLAPSEYYRPASSCLVKICCGQGAPNLATPRRKTQRNFRHRGTVTMQKLS